MLGNTNIRRKSLPSKSLPSNVVINHNVWYGEKSTDSGVRAWRQMEAIHIMILGANYRKLCHR